MIFTIRIDLFLDLYYLSTLLYEFFKDICMFLFLYLVENRTKQDFKFFSQTLEPAV